MNYSDYAKQWATKRASQQHFAHDFLEKPAIQSLLPHSVEGLSILCLGCGSGEECAEFVERGAARVVGVDNAQGLIEFAKMQFPQCEFIAQDMLDSDFAPASFDLVYSSLAFHYVEDWQQLFSKIHRWLKPGGQCVFSTHHPVKWGARSQKNKQFTQFSLGYKKNKIDGSYTIDGDYLTPRPITETLFGQVEITHYHRPFSAMLKTFHDTHFQITDCLEPLPTKEAKTQKPDFYQVHSRVPLFIVWELAKRVS